MLRRESVIIIIAAAGRFNRGVTLQLVHQTILRAVLQPLLVLVYLPVCLRSAGLAFTAIRNPATTPSGGREKKSFFFSPFGSRVELKLKMLAGAT